MKVSLNWLKDYVEVNLPLNKLAERLTMAGLELGGIQSIGAGWENIFIGIVVGLQKHPNADKLQLTTVDLGGEQWTVICGAPNIAVGQKVPFAKVGARLYDGHTGELVTLKLAEIRGVRSEGMVCSEKELGISDRHEGIMVLSDDAPVGKPLAEYLGDIVFDVSITPNRPDCLNIIGIAREVAALTGAKLHLPKIDYEEQDIPTEEMVSIEILDPKLCPRYCGGIIQGVKFGPSPQWIQQRLLACGMRPINNIVDITNFVMLEYGQPLHAFDYEGIGGRKIVVRRAREGERLFTLDGEERKLSCDMLVIADEEYPIALAGVMGGAESEVTERTSTILLESANFNNVNIRRTSFSLGLTSEASSRFDKGLSPDLPMPAILRAIGLITEFAGGKATRGIIDVYPGSTGQRKPILLSQQRANQVLGVNLGFRRIKGTLESLGFACEQKNETELSVTAPYWRTDVKIADDLIEETARIIGYEQIPIRMLTGEVPQHEPNPLAVLRDQIKDILVGCGMQEVINYSLTSGDILRKTRYQEELGEPMRVANPLSREQEFLRVSLRGGLLRLFANSERYENKVMRLFEMGKVYLPQKSLPQEKEMLGGIIGGPRFESAWLADKGSFDFFYAKGILETLFAHLGIETRFEPNEDKLLLSGRTASILINGKNVGIVGELHPDVATDFDISSQPICLFEVEVEALLPFWKQTRTFQPIPRYPATDRDIALLLNTNVSAQRVVDIIQSFPQVINVTVFDVYQGKQIPQEKKSLAFSIRYRSLERTLTDDEVDKIQQNILTRLYRELGAVLRK